jgi:hypothetical protein
MGGTLIDRAAASLITKKDRNDYTNWGDPRKGESVEAVYMGKAS